MSSLIAYFGGSFDPIHQGHLATAQYLTTHLALEKLYFLPAYLSPLKSQSLDSTHRVAMLNLAIFNEPKFAIDTQELLRPPPSYTIDTLKALRLEHKSEQPLAFIMGMDSFINLPKWHNWQKLTDFVHLIVVSRPSYTPIFSTELQQWLNKRRCNEPQMLEYHAAGLIYFVETPPYDMSSTQLRAAIAGGQMTQHELPQSVIDYIYQHHLYGATATNES